MNTFFVSHIRISEALGSITERVLAVYKTHAWNLDELEAWARRNIPAQPTLEYLKYSRQPPQGAEVREITQ